MTGAKVAGLLLVWVVASVVFVGAPNVAGETVRVGAPAPELATGRWINSEPLSLRQLRGKVVLVEFWTYG
jgi:hypothetical protein